MPEWWNTKYDEILIEAIVQHGWGDWKGKLDIFRRLCDPSMIQGMY